MADSWEAQTLPRLKAFLPARWFEKLTAERGDILSFDFRPVLEGKRRVLLFWDAHGFEVAEFVLGSLLPRLAALEHVVTMHDMSDNRYAAPEQLEYGDVPLWKGGNAEQSRIQLGFINSAVEQSISVVDFTTRNRLTLDSADHSFHTRFDGRPEGDEMLQLLGPELFSAQGPLVLVYAERTLGALHVSQDSAAAPGGHTPADSANRARALFVSRRLTASSSVVAPGSRR